MPTTRNLQRRGKGKDNEVSFLTYQEDQQNSASLQVLLPLLGACHCAIFRLIFSPDKTTFSMHSDSGHQRERDRRERNECCVRRG